VLNLNSKTSMRCTVMAPGGGTWNARRDHSGVSRLGAPGGGGSSARRSLLREKFKGIVRLAVRDTRQVV